MLDLIVAAAMAATLAGEAPSANAAAAAADVAATSVVDPKEKLTCRSVRTTGSRMPARVCKPRREWEGRAASAQEKTDEWQAEQRRANRGGDNGSSAAGGRQSRVRDTPPAVDRPF